jgi:DNA modification methylase
VSVYHEDDRSLIFHADALDVLRRGLITEPVAAIVTDPPYASGTRKETGRPGRGGMRRGERWAEKPIANDRMTTTGFVWLIRETIAAALPLLTEGGAVLSFIDWRQWPTLVGALESLNLRVNGMVVWDKRSMGLGNGFRAQHELVVFASNGTPNVHDRSKPNVLAVPRDRDSEHPSPKPVALMRSLLEVVTAPGNVVLDPFMGAGATLVAARTLGRRGIGIEIEEKYCRMTVDRFESESEEAA